MHAKTTPPRPVQPPTPLQTPSTDLITLDTEIGNNLGLDVESPTFYREVNRGYTPQVFSALHSKRLAQILHSRLRTNCSSLNQHLYSKNIVQSSLCACGSTEDIGHFLLHCPLYRNYRQDMLRSVSRLCQPSLNTLLYGNDNLSVSDNKQKFIIVQDFIVKTKRFQFNR